MLSLLKYKGALVFVLALALMGAFFFTFQQYRVTRQLLQTEKERVIALESKLRTLSEINKQHSLLIENLQVRNAELLNSYSERRQTITRIIHANPTVKNWGDSDVPDDIKRLLKRNKD